MKTIDGIKAEIAESEKYILEKKEDKSLKSRELKKITKEIVQKRQYIKYLEHNPSSENMERDLRTFKERTKNIAEKFDLWKSNRAPAEKSLKSLFEVELGIKDARIKIKALEYLLEK